VTVTRESLRRSAEEYEARQGQASWLVKRIEELSVRVGRLEERAVTRVLDAHDYEAHRNRADVRRAIASDYERQRTWFYATVAKVGKYGFKIKGDDRWLNWCKHATPQQPEVGREYRVVVDGNWKVHQLIPVVEGTSEVIPF